MERTLVQFEAAVFDMDGVVTRTADLHAAAWKELFDAWLAERVSRGAAGFRPFDAEADYLALVDGKPRYEGVQSFLASRDLRLAEGDPSDGAEKETVCGLGNRKDALFERRLREEGAASYASTIALIERLRAAGVRVGLVTSSRHGREVLERAGVTRLFDVILDGVDAAKLQLPGKPEPDTFLSTVQQLGSPPRQSIVVEDAVSGVQAGRAGHFGFVVGVDRGGNRLALAQAGADLVVSDLAALSVDVLNARFQEEAQERALRESAMLADEAWRIEQEGFDPAREHEMESLFTVGNGYLGVRGAPDAPLPGSQADLFVAGIYDRKHPERPYSELEFLTEDRGDDPHAELVSLPFPFVVRVRVDGQALDLASGTRREQRRVLDLNKGYLRGHVRHEDERGRRTLVETWRLASLADPHLLMQEVRVTCENYSGLIELEADFDEAELAVKHPHLRPQPTQSAAGLEVRRYGTSTSRLEVALASRACLLGETRQAAYYQTEGRTGSAVVLRRYVCICTNRDVMDPADAAIARVTQKRWDAFDAEREAHEARWAQFWEVADIRTEGSPAVAQALRFNAYHLRIAADHDPRISVGARTLSGRAYEGHIFWDVEMFMLPFYVHTCPDVARTLVMYRHHTLSGARQRARELGYRGACYAWESTVTGADVTPTRITLKSNGREIPIYTGLEQVHVSAAVAHGVWSYYDATHDEDFMHEAGVEILLETARFWTSRCVRGSKHYHLRGVTGPDEYHHTVNDNAYTNWMARFNIEKALWSAGWLAERQPEQWQRLRTALSLTQGEMEVWQAISRELYCPEPEPSTGLIEQFEGFFALNDTPLPEAERFQPPISRLFAAEEVNRSQLIKQADVLMLLYLFPDLFPRDVLAANYRYYEPRTDHGSSLSPPIHATLATRLGLHREAQRYWRRSLWLDLSNTMGNGALGVHAACMAGAWQALVFGFMDVRPREDGPALGPAAGAGLPAQWRAVDLKLAWRGGTYPLRFVRDGEATT